MKIKQVTRRVACLIANTEREFLYLWKVDLDLPARVVAITPTLTATAAVAARAASRTMRLVAITTIYRTVFTWNKWNRGQSPTVSTSRFIMLDIARTRR